MQALFQLDMNPPPEDGAEAWKQALDAAWQDGAIGKQDERNREEDYAYAAIAIETESDMVRAARLLQERWGCSVLVKGGHASDKATDILCHGGSSTAFLGTRVDNPNTHGTGCTLSSAIAAHLAQTGEGEAV